MAFNTSFPSPKRLPGSKKTFPNVSGRVNSFNGRKSLSKLPVTSVPAAPEKPGKDSRKIDPAVGHQKRSAPANVSHAKKIRTHHDSSAVSACLKTATATRTQRVQVKPTAPVQKPDITTSRTAGQVKPVKPKTMDRTDRLFAMKPLPGKKKTLEDFVRKPFRANPVPLTTYKLPKDCSAVKQEPHPSAKKIVVQSSPPEKVKPVPFRARPVPASTYVPSIQPAVRKIHKVEKTDVSVVPVDEAAVGNDVKISEPIDEPASCEPETVSGPNGPEVAAAAL